MHCSREREREGEGGKDREGGVKVVFFLGEGPDPVSEVRDDASGLAILHVQHHPQ